MSNLTTGYCLVSGILFLFFVGSGSIVCDMILNQEREIIIRKQVPKAKPDLPQLISNEYEYDDEILDT